MEIKTVSFLSGKVLIGKVDSEGNWFDALFVSMVQHPETGERTAYFSPVAAGRASQNLSRGEFLSLVSFSAYVGPSLAASGLVAAYTKFIADEEAVIRCVKIKTTECGPSDAFVGILPECQQPVKVEKEGDVIKVDFGAEKEIPHLKDL